MYIQHVVRSCGIDVQRYVSLSIGCERFLMNLANGKHHGHIAKCLCRPHCRRYAAGTRSFWAQISHSSSTWNSYRNDDTTASICCAVVLLCVVGSCKQASTFNFAVKSCRCVFLINPTCSNSCSSKPFTCCLTAFKCIPTCQITSSSQLQDRCVSSCGK